jgi:hypothetical protein
MFAFTTDEQEAIHMINKLEEYIEVTLTRESELGNYTEIQFLPQIKQNASPPYLKTSLNCPTLKLCWLNVLFSNSNIKFYENQFRNSGDYTER